MLPAIEKKTVRAVFFFEYIKRSKPLQYKDFGGKFDEQATNLYTAFMVFDKKVLANSKFLLYNSNPLVAN